MYLLLLLMSLFTFAQRKKPPGTVRINDTLYVDQIEVTNIHWLEYEFYVSRDSIPEYHQSILPISAVTDIYRPYYFRYPGYKDYPVVGISYEQASEYCIWRTKVVNLKLADENSTFRVNFRLPTELEWEVAAKTIDSLRVSKPLYNSPDFYFKSNRKEFREEFPDREIDIKKLKKEIKAYSNSKVIAFQLDYERPWFIRKEDRLPQITHEYPIDKDDNHI
ncbi:MAG: SUMF1/EgtB/PvdO family nonheme iron enzyme, partial [Ekhidna sp.]|nr:SUMF1/EgtB/PvdO family nonheme iron enzyme [Ekhidna sp.]